jgi:signal transduction histidine kinase
LYTATSELKTSLYLILITIVVCSCQNKSLPTAATTPYFDSIVTRADRIYDSGDKDKALSFIKNNHAAAHDLTVDDDINYYTFCNIFYTKKQQYDSALSFTDSLLLELEKNESIKDNPDHYIKAYNAKADALFAIGLYSESYDYYYRAQKLAMEHADSCALGSYSYILGMVLYRQQRYNESAMHFIDAYRIAGSCTDDFANFYFRQEVLDNTGLCYTYMRQYDSAMLYFNMALAYINKNFGRFPHKQPSVYSSAQAVIYGNMAAVYVAEKKYDTAIALYNKSVHINLQKGFANSDALIEQVKLANIYYERNSTDSMKRVLVAVRAELDSIPDSDTRMSYNKLMWHYYDHTGDSVNAYRYLSAYTTMHDSLQLKNKSLMDMDIEGHVKSIGKQYEIELLNRENSHKKMFLIVLVLVLLLAMVIIVLVLIYSRRSRNTVTALTELNNEVNKQKLNLETALTQLEVKDKDKSRILRSVAHDVMNPISAIIALAEILMYDETTLNADQKEIVLLIKEACNNSLSLSRDILEAAVAIDPNNLPKEPVNISKLVENSVELLSMRAQAKGQVITATYSSDNIEALANKDKIWRVVNNLLTNAIKFSYPDSEIRIHTELVNDRVRIAIKDNGIGIPEKNRKSIFDMFTDSKMPGTQGEIPHGMGLSISMQIAKAHNGNLYVESTEGKGSTFYFEFPVK